MFLSEKKLLSAENVLQNEYEGVDRNLIKFLVSKINSIPIDLELS